jgi:hypothetical protein
MSLTTLEPKTASVKTHAERSASQFERYDTIDTPKIVVVGFISAILTFVVILGAQAIFFATDNAEAQRKMAAAAPTALTDGWTQQQNRLAGYGWVDPAKGVVSIPISDAMRLVVEEQQAKNGAASQ